MKNRDNRERKRKEEGGREDKRPWGQRKGKREREFVVYFIIVFKEPHLFWREELSLTNIQTIFTIQELKNRITTIPYLRRERELKRERERERRGKRSRKKEGRQEEEEASNTKVIYCNITSHIYKFRIQSYSVLYSIISN